MGCNCGEAKKARREAMQQRLAEKEAQRQQREAEKRNPPQQGK